MSSIDRQASNAERDRRVGDVELAGPPGPDGVAIVKAAARGWPQRRSRGSGIHHIHGTANANGAFAKGPVKICVAVEDGTTKLLASLPSRGPLGARSGLEPEPRGPSNWGRESL